MAKKILSLLAIGAIVISFSLPIIAYAGCTVDSDCTSPRVCISGQCENPANGFGVTLQNPLCPNGGGQVCSVQGCNTNNGRDMECPTGSGTRCGTIAACCTEYSGTMQPSTCINSIPSLLTTITNYITGIIASIAVVIFIYAGFLYLTSAGNPEKISRGNKAVIYGIVGLAIALAGQGLIDVIKAVIGA
jgi:hypothetical protein